MITQSSPNRCAGTWTVVTVSNTTSTEAEETLVTQCRYSGAHALIHLDFILPLQADGVIGSIGTEYDTVASEVCQEGCIGCMHRSPGRRFRVLPL